MSRAMTDDVIIKVRIASFYPLNDSAKQDVCKVISETIVDLSHKHNFLVYSVGVESKNETNK